MRRMSKSFEKEISPVTLYEEDISRAFELLGFSSELDIDDGEHSYESMDDFINNNKGLSVKKLNVRAYLADKGSFSLRIDSSRVMVSGDERLYASCAALSDFLSSRVKWYSTSVKSTALVSIIFGLFFSSFLMMAIIFGWMCGADLYAQRTWLFLWVISLLMNWAIWTEKIRVGRSKIVMIRRSDAKGFIERNKDEIVIVVLTAIITTAINEIFK